jgi:hypothetical protein
MSTFLFRNALLAIVATLFATSARAQWSTDPSNNLIVALHNTGSQVAPHMVATPDGGFYVSWLDAGAQYSVRLRRIDASGNLMWGANGVLVYTRNEQFVYDYGLDIDSAGNALLSFDQGRVVTDSNGTHYLPGGNILATKIAPDGSFVWGAGGVQVSPPGEVEYLGKIAATSDGGAAVAWFNANGETVVQKLDASGNPLWLNTPTFSASGGAYIADIHGADNGNAIISWRGSSGGTLQTQKLASADGSSMWGANGLTLSDGSATTGGLQTGYAPTFVSDGAGGAAYAWYVTKGVAAATSRVQHVSSGGVLQFSDNAGNGVDVSANNAVDGAGTHVQVNPALAYDASTGDIYVVFEDFYQTFNAFAATFAQRIDNTGLRQWTDNGLELESYITNGQSFTIAVPLNGGLIAAWASGGPTTTTSIVAQRLNADGSFAWSSAAPAPVKTSTTSPSRIYGANSTQGYAALVWEDGNEGGAVADIRAQNLRYDGLLGNATGAAPGVPQLDPGSDSGVSNADGVTNVATPTFNGTCATNGDSVQLAVDGAPVAPVGTCTANAYSITLTGTLAPDGVHTIKAFEFNATGSSPYSASSSMTLDTTPPAITLDTTPSNPTSSSDASFTFSIDDPRPTQCQIDAGGFVACTSPTTYSNLAVGPHTFTVQANDVAGNLGTTSYTWTIQPDPVPVYLDSSTDSGRSNSDGITNANPLLFTGPCTDGDTIKVFAGAATLGTTTCSGGTYSVSTSALTSDGNKSISANATRDAVAGPTGTVLHITIDRHAPAAPSITGPSTAGPSAMVSGTAEVNSTVAVTEGVNALCTALTDGTGAWSCNASFPLAGTNALKATATDVAGNTSPASSVFNVSVDLSDLIFRNGFDD